MTINITNMDAVKQAQITDCFTHIYF